MTNKAKLKRFRAIGHQLNPVVTIAGKGLSESVLAELNRALEDHELIKVRVHADDRKDREETLASLIDQTRAEMIQQIGNVGLIYRAAEKPNAKLSNILRAELL